MRDAFRTWLIGRGLPKRTTDTYFSDALRVEKNYGDLDEAYDQNRLQSLLAELAYSMDDQRSGKLNPARFPIEGNIYKGLASYRVAVRKFVTFRLAEAEGDTAAVAPFSLKPNVLAEFKQTFLGFFPDFEGLGFQADKGKYWSEERDYKEQTMRRARAILDSSDSEEETGRAMIELMKLSTNIVGWRTFANIKAVGEAKELEIAAALGHILADPGDVATTAAECAAQIHPLLADGALNNAAYGQTRTLVTTILAFARPEEAIAVKTRIMQSAARRLTGQRLFETGVMTREEYARMLAFAEQLFVVMRDEWGWAPLDLWDVQGFLFIVWHVAEQPTPEDTEADDTDAEMNAMIDNQNPTNLILYGPPGTGKTYETASRAVALCDGYDPPGGRAAVMARYRQLVERKRIAFVTFHQSYSYEDFVEGLRPETVPTGDGEAGEQAGFSLQPVMGVFRRIAELARSSEGRSASVERIDRSRQVFKMSLGRSREPEGAQIYRTCIDENVVMLGYGGAVDWSAIRFEDVTAIKSRWLDEDANASDLDPNIRQTHAFRNSMSVGDLVVVSDGNKRFRAIGEVVGPYLFAPAPGLYNHRREVRWLWHSDQGLDREQIYGREFSQVSIYQLDPRMIDWSTLEQIVGGSDNEEPSSPDAYVLIIDEINRANISKVFGELITLLEPDKRLGGDNPLTVTLPYSGDSFGVPSNLHIIGTMNTADRSIALLDTALRRRFDFEELMPDPNALADASAATGLDLAAALAGLNERIEYLFDRDHQIGHAYFMGCRDLAGVNRVMRNKVIPLLAEYFYEDWEKVRQALGETTDDGSFVSRQGLAPPAGSEDMAGEDRWRYMVQQQFTVEAYDQLKA